MFECASIFSVWDMQTEESSIRSCHVCGGFFFGLGALSGVLSFVGFHSGDWWHGVVLLAGVPFFGLIGWAAVADTFSLSRAGGDDGKVEAGELVPVGPSPTHHLVGAKDLPPSDKTHSYPKD
jgi:hypothetical protein